MNTKLIELRKLISEGFKEYDGDIREEALELLDEMENIDQKTIDFGIGKLNYSIHKGSASTLNELMVALNSASLVVPLTRLIEQIKKAPGNPRF